MSMPRWLLAAALTLAAALADAGEMILNSTMELGDADRPAPGFMLRIYQVGRQELLRNPERRHLARTVRREGGGKCLMVPAFPGVSKYLVQPGDMRIERDGEVELSLDARIGPAADGRQPDVRFFIDFRTLGDASVKSRPGWSHPNYPIITGLGGRLTGRWQHFSRRVKVIRWSNVYQLYLWVHAARPFEDIEAPFYLDNLKATFLDDRRDPGEEAAVIPDRPEACYFKGEPIRLQVNALLENGEGLELRLQEASHPFGKRSFPLKLAQTDAAGLPGRLRRFTGTLDLAADRYGAFDCALVRGGSPVRSAGRFNVVHRPVRHARFSPGWSIGFNSNEFVSYDAPYSRIRRMATLGAPDSLRQLGDFAQLTGFRNARIWCRWVYVEQDRGDFDAAVVDTALAPFAHTDVEPFMIIAAGAGMSFKDRGPQGEDARYPHYLYPGLSAPRKTYQGTVRLLGDGNLDDFRRYLEFCLRTWGRDIRIWELFNEPGVLDMDPQVYLRFLRLAYPLVKARVKDAILLGNGNTCDVGYDQGWCRRLAAADPDYPDSLDGIAFHPYNNATDYQKGIYNLYSRHVAELRDSLKKEKDLYNTECFYVTDARRPQIDFYMQKGRCTAEAIQRHYLDGLLNRVRMAASPDQDFMFFPDPTGTGRRTLSEGAVAVNALSAHLAGMTDLQPVRLNPYMRAGIFTDAAGTKALGFVYDLRPSGSVLAVAGKPAAELSDLFGNPVGRADGLPVSYEPLYIRGTPAQVRDFLGTARFLPTRSCRVTGVRCGGRLHLTAENLTGQPGVMEIDFRQAQGLPSVRFEFAAGRPDSTVDVPAAAGAEYGGIPFDVFGQGAKLGGGSLELRKAAPGRRIAAGEADAPELALSRGSRIKVWSDGAALRILGRVGCGRVVPAPDARLWDGDALEVFVDPAPFAEPGRNRIVGATPLDCFQYVFAAAPSKTGERLLGISRKDPAFRTRAECVSRRTDAGYELDIRIPWKEIRPRHRGVLGLEVEVARPGEKGWKESLSGARRPAYAERHHYPLFQAEDTNAVRNGDFSENSFGEAGRWAFSAQAKAARIRCVPGEGPGGGAAVVFRTGGLVPGAARGQFLHQTIPVPEDARTALVSVLAEMPECTRTDARHDRWRPAGFFLTLGAADMSHDRNTAYAEPFPWTVWQYRAPVPKGGRRLDLYAGARGVLGVLRIAEIRVEFQR